jgi:hypothetical protein
MTGPATPKAPAESHLRVSAGAGFVGSIVDQSTLADPSGPREVRLTPFQIRDGQEIRVGGLANPSYHYKSIRGQSRV